MCIQCHIPECFGQCMQNIYPQPERRKMTKHTPTPWIYQKSTQTIRSEKENYWLATMDSWDGAIDNEANAKYIVKCVNLHDELVEVLEQLYPYCEGDTSREIIEKALSKVKGEAND